MSKLNHMELVSKLLRIARREAAQDDIDFSVIDQFDSNVDDCFEGGQRDGEIMLARELLTDLGESWR